ncbi:hypothetical protein [Nostoc sp. PA-18-2419]|nr:hypothetical protein [Nostoc sp. PA-18-2419]
MIASLRRNDKCLTGYDITGDLDLLVLIAFNAIPILTPQEFLN